MQLQPITLKAANAFVLTHHRHHGTSRGCRFCLGAFCNDTLVAVAITSNPRARALNDGTTAELVRLASDGTPNACSFLYSATRRVCHAMGFKKLITYTLASENGASLKAAGWTATAQVKGRSWSCNSRPRNDTSPTADKTRWLAPPRNQP